MKKEITGWEKRQSVDSFMEEYWKQEEKLIGVFDKSQGVALNRIALEKTIMEKVVMRVETKEDGRKQYFAHLPELRVVDEVWVNGDKMATPKAIASAVKLKEEEVRQIYPYDSFEINAMIASAVEAREREISELVEKIKYTGTVSCMGGTSDEAVGYRKGTTDNREHYIRQIDKVLSIINPSKK